MTSGPNPGSAAKPAACSSVPAKASSIVDASRDGDDGFSIQSRIILASLVAGLLVVGGGTWSVMAKLSSAVIAQGQVIVDNNVKKVQHREGGIVAELLVRNGDQVRKGDIIIKLSDTQVRAELDIVGKQLAELGVKRQRLVAERDGSSKLKFKPKRIMSDEKAAMAEAIEGERRLFNSNRRMSRSQKQQLKFRVDQLTQEAKGLKAQQQSKKRELKVVRAELSQVRKLLGRKLATTARVNSLQRDFERLSGDVGGLEAQIARTEGQISEIKIKIIEVDQTAKHEAQRELRTIIARIAELESRYIAAKDKLMRMDLRAPASGEIHELNVHTVGGVVGGGETVAVIVPKAEKLTVEAKFAPIDIDQIVIGQDARLRFSAFNQRTTPELKGKVLQISADVTKDKSTGMSYYLGQLAIEKVELARIGDRKLLPGMPVEVFIKTKEHDALSYLAKPFTDNLARAFREE